MQESGGSGSSGRVLRKVMAKAPPDVWLAINCSEGEIIASGPDLAEVLNEAKSQGFTSPVLVLSPNTAAALEQEPKMAA